MLYHLSIGSIQQQDCKHLSKWTHQYNLSDLHREDVDEVAFEVGDEELGEVGEVVLHR